MSRSSEPAEAARESDGVGSLRYRVPAVARSLAIIEFLSVQREPQRLTDVCESVDVAKSTCLTILSTLEQCGYVERDAAGSWSLSLKAYTVGMERMRRSGWMEVAREHVTELQLRSRMTAHLGLLDQGEVVYALKSTGSGLVGFNTYPGFRAPLHLTALGRAMCASLTPEQRDRLFARYTFKGGTVKAPDGRAAFEIVIDEVMRRGFAVELEEEEEGVGCIAAAVCSPTAGVMAAVGVTALAMQLRDRVDELGELVCATARDIENAIGVSSPAGIEGLTLDGTARADFPGVSGLSRRTKQRSMPRS